MNAIARIDTDATRWDAVQRRDPAADGHFLYAVVTTGVYCRPSCAARPARRENVSFHADPAAAERAGFRACKRCKPDQPPRAEREAALVAEICRQIETAEEEPSLDALAAVAGFSACHFHRLFRRVAGVTPRAYAAAQKARRVQHGLQDGARVTEAMYQAGFNSSGRFYAAADAMLGMTPSAYRAGAPGETIRMASGTCSLGMVLVGATARGVCAILLGDDADVLGTELRSRFPHATLQPAEKLADVLGQVIAHIDQPGAGTLALPLDIRGTAFQRRVWEVLRSIPPGETRRYGEVAAQLGAPQSQRAVAGACAANAIAVVIPCHRVVPADGGTGGYRWGAARKQALLERERT